MGRRLTFSDSHGGYKAMVQCLDRCKFDNKEDTLYFLGDVVDGWSETKESIDLLRSIKNLVLITGNHDCYHKDTEYLTENGWKKYNDISSNDKLAQFEINTRKITFSNYISRIENFSEKMIQIEGNNTLQIVTPNHDIILDHKKVKAKDILNLNINEDRFILSGKIEKYDKYPIDDNMLKLITWIMMDGSIVFRNNKIHHYQIKLSREDKISKLKDVLSSCNLKYTEQLATKSGVNKLQPYIFRIYGDQARTIFNFLPNKNVPLWFKYLNSNQINIVLNSILDTDGSKQDNRITWTTVNKHNADTIQQMCLMNNIPCHIREYISKNGFNIGGTQFKVTISFFNYPQTYKVKIDEVKYNDSVYCFTMPEGTLITRFNGKYAFSGNCWTMEYYSGIMTKDGFGDEFNSWNHHGGLATRKSYGLGNTMYREHFQFLSDGEPYHITDDNILFVHAGIDIGIPIDQQDPNSLYWNRSFVKGCYFNYKNNNILNIDPYREIYVGHTPTIFLYKKYTKPFTMGNVTMVDTGAAFSGCLSILDIDSKQVWQSDNVKYLYPDEKGRNDLSWNEEKEILGL